MTYTKALFLLALSLLLWQVPVHAQNVVEDLEAYPSFMEAFSHYYSGYAFPRDEKEEHFLEKRPDGYWIGLRNRADWEDVIEKPVLLWSRAERKYVVEEAEKANEKGEVDRLLSSYGYEASRYDKHPFYGYEGWDMDVINELGKAKEMPEKLLNGLARAYSYHAGALLHDRAGGKPTEEVLAFNKSFDPEAFSSATIKEYENYIGKSIATFKRLDEQNPSYKLIVGYPKMKWANEYMTAYLDLLIIGQEKRAKSFLKSGTYPSIYLSLARNILASCPQNAILLTNGDNDTYPILHVQETDNFRKDVRLINISLLNSPVYLNYLINLLPAGELPKLSLSLDVYKDERMGAVVEVKPEKSLPAHPFLKEMEERMKKDKDPAATEFARIQLRDGHGLSQPTGTTPVYELFFGGQAYGPRRLWLRSHIFLVDLLEANSFKRPICFSSGIPHSQFPRLSDYFWETGFVYQLLPYQPDENHPNFKSPETRTYRNHTQESARHFIHSFDYEGLKTWEPTIPLKDIGLRRSMRMSMVRLLYVLSILRDFDSAPELVSLYTKHFMASGERFDGLNLMIAEYAYDAGMKAEAEKIANDLFANANRIGTELLSGEVLEESMTNNLRLVLSRLDQLFDQLGNAQRAEQSRDLQKRVNTLFE